MLGMIRRKHKYGAKKTIVTADGTMFEVEQLIRHNITDITGIQFDSKMEAEYYLDLLARKKLGEINAIELQPVYVLQDKPKIKYIPDFRITYPTGHQEIIDVKGTQTAAFRIKAKMFRAKYPFATLVLVTKKGRQWIAKEVG